MTMNKTVTIPSKGHFLYEDTEILPSCEAFERVQNSAFTYTAAKRDAGPQKIRLLRHWYECANCLREFPMSAAPENEDEEEGEDEECETGQPERNFCGWALQLTFPEVEMYEDDYMFFPLPDKDKPLICPHCGYSAPATTRSFAYGIDASPYRTVITQVIEAAERYIAMPYETQGLPYDCFPLTVKLIFNHESRQTVFTVSDYRNELIEQKDLKGQFDPLKGYTLLSHINTDTPLKGALTEALGQFHLDGIPFAGEEAGLDIFVLLNRFQGFPRKFYEAIPFAKNSYRAEKSFAEPEHLLARYTDIPEVYKRFGLPNKKSIRRTVFENPVLLFYAETIATLPFHNPDVTTRILRSEEAFSFLSELHTQPGISLFLTAMIAEKGEANTWTAIQNKLEFLRGAAAAYLLSSPDEQKLILHDKIDDTVCRFEYRVDRRFTLPVGKHRGADISDCRIGIYDFMALKNVFEYRKAAASLRNCLAEYRSEGGQVIGVKSGGEYLAAIEVRKNRIRQVFLADNEPIETDSELHKTFKQWADTCRLKVDETL